MQPNPNSFFSEEERSDDLLQNRCSIKLREAGEMYDIEIDYMTGDSFGSERVKELACIITSDKEKAKENLKRIKDHYVNHSDDADYGKRRSLAVLSDQGERTIVPFWIGYFEILYGAKVVALEDDDMSFEL